MKDLHGWCEVKWEALERLEALVRLEKGIEAMEDVTGSTLDCQERPQRGKSPGEPVSPTHVAVCVPWLPPFSSGTILPYPGHTEELGLG
jgi:hypothetical protein